MAVVLSRTAAQVGELSEQLGAAEVSGVVDHEVGVGAASLADEHGGAVPGDVANAGAFPSVAVGVDGGAVVVLVGHVEVLDASFVDGHAVFVEQDFSHAHGGHLDHDGSGASQASTVQGQALGQGDGLGAWAGVLHDVFQIHRLTSCGCSPPRWMRRRRSGRTLFFTAAQAAMNRFEAVAPGLVVPIEIGFRQTTSVTVFVEVIAVVVAGVGRPFGVVGQENTNGAVASTLETVELAGGSQVVAHEFRTGQQSRLEPNTAVVAEAVFVGLHFGVGRGHAGSARVVVGGQEGVNP